MNLGGCNGCNFDETELSGCDAKQKEQEIGLLKIFQSGISIQK